MFRPLPSLHPLPQQKEAKKRGEKEEEKEKKKRLIFVLDIFLLFIFYNSIDPHTKATEV